TRRADGRAGSPGGDQLAVARAARHGRARARRTADRDTHGHRDTPERARARRDEPDPLAEPLARRAPEPHVLPERFRGRIANRVMQTGGSLRESAMSAIRAVWYQCL